MSETTDITVPALRRGKAFVGPEAYGCLNTGTRPMILHSRVTGLWLVGPENHVDEARIAIRLAENQGRRRLVYAGGKIVHVYKTRGPAVKRFRADVDGRRAMNGRLRAACSAAADDARSSDPETAIAGAVAMMDY